jgi:hypothetical protein
VTDNPTTRAFADYVAGELRVEVAPGDAIPLLRRSRDTARAVGNRFVAGIAGLSAVSCEARTGDPAGVLDEYAELLEHFHRAGTWGQLWTAIRALIQSLDRAGRPEPAALLSGALSATTRATPIIGADAARLAEVTAGLRVRLGDAESERLAAEGAAMDDEEAVAYALRAVAADAGRL